MSTKAERDAIKSLLLEVVKRVHKKKLDVFVQRLITRISSSKSSIATRSKKYPVECNVTSEELRRLIIEQYGMPCKYCHTPIKLDNMVFDHIHPISKGGHSNIENFQLICRTCNGMKGSLVESSYLYLLDWLKTAPEDIQTDVRVRLARGVH